MKIECLRDRLRDGVVIAERIAGKNLTLPVLGTILLETGNKTLIIKSTNLEVGVEIEIPARVDSEGSVAVNANILNNFLSNLGKESKVYLQTDNENLKITTDNTETIIKSLNTEDFPIIPKIAQEGGFTIDSTILANGLKSVVFAAAVSDIKPEISSVYIYNKEEELCFVATDSFRLAENRIKLKELIKEQINLIIPIKSVLEIIKTIDNLEAKLIVSFNKNQLAVQTDNLYLTLRIIDGTYPDYQQIIPTKFGTELSLKKDELLSILKLANLFTDKFNQINIKIDPKSNVLNIDSCNQDVGENKFSLITKVKGDPLEISFNARYLIDCLNSTSGDSIHLKFTDKNRPLVMSGSEDDTFCYLVMPINK